jgi:hypothetical protein
MPPFSICITYLEELWTFATVLPQWLGNCKLLLDHYTFTSSAKYNFDLKTLHQSKLLKTEVSLVKPTGGMHVGLVN